MIIEDIQLLKQALLGKLQDMPDPEADLDAYWRLPREYPAEWKALVRTYHIKRGYQEYVEVQPW